MVIAWGGEWWEKGQDKEEKQRESLGLGFLVTVCAREEGGERGWGSTRAKAGIVG